MYVEVLYVEESSKNKVYLYNFEYTLLQVIIITIELQGIVLETTNLIKKLTVREQRPR